MAKKRNTRAADATSDAPKVNKSAIVREYLKEHIRISACKIRPERLPVSRLRRGQQRTSKFNRLPRCTGAALRAAQLVSMRHRLTLTTTPRNEKTLA